MMASLQHKKVDQVLLVLGARVAAALTRAFFRVLRLFPQQEKVVFMSRQGARPLDFRLLEPALRERFPGCRIAWACLSASSRLTPAMFARQLWHAATAKLCIVDGYVPAVSVCEGLHRAPCVQLWHALGALKKFGCQSLDTPAGHNGQIAQALRMHRGYSCMVAGLPGAAGDLSRAFGCEPGKVVALGLPRVDYLLERRACADGGDAGALNLPPVLQRVCKSRDRGTFVLLYAPTFRKGAPKGSFRLDDVVRGLRASLPEQEVTLLVARHPLQSQRGDGSQPGSLAYLDGVSAVEALCCVDAVITDYSAIAFEAWLAGKRVFFYVPDIDRYRRSPGLNVDPLDAFPDVAFKHVADVAAAVADYVRLHGEGGAGQVEPTSFDVFMSEYAGDLESGCTQRIADHVKDLVEGKRCKRTTDQRFFVGDDAGEGESHAGTGA